MKKLSAILICICLILSEYFVGDRVQYGSYPQSKVTDESTLALLESVEKTWISYGYYSGTGDEANGKMEPSDCMFYADIDLDGDGLRDYRAVRIDEERPMCTGYTAGDSDIHEANGYTAGNIYYFKFEPIEWRILDPDDGLIMTEKLIDSQPYNNFLLASEPLFAEDKDPICWGNADQTYYANDYYNSSIRQWLNNDFYNTAFTSSQASNIRNDVTLNNNSFSADYPQYNSQASKDKIFLLSWDEALKEEYGFSSSAQSEGEETGRMAKGTDYAKSQGLFADGGYDPSIKDNGYWILRSPAGVSYGECFVTPDGYQDTGFFVSVTSGGVRPACRLYELNLDTVYSVGVHIQYGNYPQSKVTDENTLALLEGADKNWISYRYYSGSGEWDDGNMTPSDYMFYADIDLDGDGLRDYRAVRIDEYRQYDTGYTAGGSKTYQDENGYTTENIYYFKFEPIKWRVLDPDDGLIMTEKIMDSQAYNNFLLTTGGADGVDENDEWFFWGNADKTYYANDYYNSSIRQWLNNDFYNTAFTSSQASNIRNDVTLNNDTFSADYPQYNSQESKDKIFLLSWDESLTTAYGFLSSEESYYNDTGRTAQGTDYAKSQGLCKNDRYMNNPDGNSNWWLRSPSYASYYACYVTMKGTSDNGIQVDSTAIGVRPACRLSVLKNDIAKTSIDNNNGSGTETDCSNGHVDENNDGKCDRCGDAIEGFNPSATCKHICHKTGIARFFYKIALFFWKLFKINKECSCGIAHY